MKGIVEKAYVVKKDGTDTGNIDQTGGNTGGNGGNTGGNTGGGNGGDEG